MSILHTLKINMVKTPLVSQNKDEVLRELVEILAAAGEISDAGQAYDAVLSRELKGSTGLGEEIAIPHAKTATVAKVAMAVGIAPMGIDFQSLDGLPSKMFFLILANPEFASVHIDALSDIAKITRNKEFCAACLRAKNGEELLALMQAGL
jgi:mannitol/fructose-specific phosphotransferase system IIA component (Ntr-type)